MNLDLAQLKPVFKLISLGSGVLGLLLMFPFGLPIHLNPESLFLASIATHFLSE